MAQADHVDIEEKRKTQIRSEAPKRSVKQDYKFWELASGETTRVISASPAADRMLSSTPATVDSPKTTQPVGAGDGFKRTSEQLIVQRARVNVGCGCQLRQCDDRDSASRGFSRPQRSRPNAVEASSWF